MAQGCLEPEGSGAHRGTGCGWQASMASVSPEWFPAAIVFVLPGLLGTSLSRRLGEGVGQEEDVQSPPKGPRNVSQEGEKERGDPSLSERGRQGPLTNE